MIKHYVGFILLLMLAPKLQAQNETSSNPLVDWRQHNVIKYNRHIFNPTFSLVRQEGRDLSIWSRIQWIGIEDSPKTYLINYSGKVAEKTGAGLALFQQNLGLYTDSGLLVNYAKGIQLSRFTWLTFGLNTTVFRRGLDKNAFVTPQPDPFLLDTQDDFILVFMPGINLTINNIDIGFTAENLYDYNLTESNSVTTFSEKIFSGHIGYTHSFTQKNTFMTDGSVRSLVYAKHLPEQDLQYGASVLIDAPKHGWIQVGYNSVYGISGGIGAKIGNSFGVGFLVETGTQQSNRAFGATYEVTATIELGKSYNNKPITFKEGPVSTTKKKEKVASEISKTNTKVTKPESTFKQPEQIVKPSNKQKSTSKQTNTTKQVEQAVIVKDTSAIQETNLTDKSIQTMSIESLDSLGIDKDSDQELLKDVFNEEAPNKRYQVEDRIEGVEYGFYLVVNVFSQKKYFDLFMKFLTQRGLSPKYFYNNENNYYYVYLKKYDKLSEIENARRTRYNGRYFGETWILWVKNN